VSEMRQRLARVLAEHVAPLPAIQGGGPDAPPPGELGPVWVREDADHGMLTAVVVDPRMGVVLVVHLAEGGWEQTIALGREDWSGLLGAARALGWAAERSR